MIRENGSTHRLAKVVFIVQVSLEGSNPLDTHSLARSHAYSMDLKQVIHLIEDYMSNEILQGNVKIAEFMGAVNVGKRGRSAGDWYDIKEHPREEYTNVTGGEWYTTTLYCTEGILYTMQYHASWDWLMPVVEKIEGLFNDSVMFNINSHKSFIELDTQRSIAYNLPEMPDFYSGLCDSKIQAVYKTILQFIDWYTLNVTPS